MLERACQSLRDGQSQTEALTTVALRIAELMELQKDIVLLELINAYAGVPHFKSYSIAALAAGHEDARLDAREIEQCIEHCRGRLPSGPRVTASSNGVLVCALNADGTVGTCNADTDPVFNNMKGVHVY